MVLYRSTVLLVTCASCLGFVSSPARGFIHPDHSGELSISSLPEPVALNSLTVAENSAPASDALPPLQPGDRGPAVQELQSTLKFLGYYKGAEDGFYGDSTADAVAKFQQETGLEADGVAGATTLDSLQKAKQAKQPIASTPAPAPAAKPGKASFFKGKLGWLLLGVGGVALVAVVGGLFYLLIRSDEAGGDLPPGTGNRKELKPGERTGNKSVSQGKANSGNVPQNYQGNGYDELGPVPEKNQGAESSESGVSDALAVGPTTRLSKIDIVDELIEELQAPDPTKRRKAIWELGQRGDSRAVQPLVNLMIDSDSQQRSLILAALSEIGTRTLKPMNRALAVSLQDDNAEVRKNAIRDLTRIYDLIGQMSQLLRLGVEDPDQEVRETARWALGQLNHVRGLPAGERVTLPNSGSSGENSSGVE